MLCQSGYFPTARRREKILYYPSPQTFFPTAKQKLKKVKKKIRELKAREKTERLERKYKEMEAKWKREHPGIMSKARKGYKYARAKMARPRKTI